ICLDFGPPSRGDIVVFNTPSEAALKCGEGGTFVKRVIGLPGDTVREDDNGFIWIRGPGDKTFVKLKEPYLTTERRLADTAHFGQVWHVPAGQYFMMGDNRASSCDSRSWGSVPRGKLIGTGFFVYWPPDRIGFRQPCYMWPSAVRPSFHEQRHPGHRARADAECPAVQGGRHGACPLPGDRGNEAARPGVRGNSAQATGSRRARNLHRAQAVLRRGRRADVPAPLAEDREDRGRRDRRRQPREALLPARPGGQEGAGPRAPLRRRLRAAGGGRRGSARVGGRSGRG